MESLSPVTRKFILHWGEMSTRWGINRSAAQIHALLYLSSEPLSAEEISERLSMARSNVSTCLRELRAWGIVRVVHRLGERRDRFECVEDVWEMLRTILEQRKRREIDPTMEMLHSCIDEAESSKTEHSHTRKRMNDLLEMLTLVTSLYEELITLPVSAQKKVLKLGSKIRKLTV